MMTTHFHPMLVHFPIVLVIAGFIAEIVYLIFKRKDVYTFSFYLLLFGTLASIPTLLTGVFFTSEMYGAAGEVKDFHELFAWISVGLLLATSIISILTRRKENRNLTWIAFSLYTLATVSIGITGFFGGTLVYNYMMPL